MLEKNGARRTCGLVNRVMLKTVLLNDYQEHVAFNQINNN